MRTSRRLILSAAVISTCLCVSGAPAALSQDLGWGSTHATWEKQALRSTLLFKDSTARATRDPSGSVKATLTHNDGEILARLELAPGRTSALRLKTRQKGEPGWSNSTEIPYTAPESPVLDWLNIQLYSWSKDFPDKNDALFQPDQSSKLKLQVDSALKDVVGAELDFGNEYSRSISIGSGFITHLWERSPRDLHPRPRRISEESPADGDKLLAVLVWRDDRQELLFSVGADLQKQQFYLLGAEDLPNGYFHFQPTMGWANIQIRQLWSQRLIEALDKNDPGCDGLHYFDNTSFRRCCDQHDRCYEAHVVHTGAPCTASSWYWPLCATTPSCTWRCQICNAQAVLCFVLRLVLEAIPNPGSPGTGEGFDCYIGFPSYCPAYCRSCIYGW